MHEKDRNPQAVQMADESMLRNLAAQATAIWPEESRLFARYRLPHDARIIDVGCGSGEITRRLASLHPGASVVGVDLLEASVAHAARAHAALAPRVRFEQGDAFALAYPDASFDLAVCRHMTQAVPEPERVLAEMLRVVRPGGVVHVLSEDYSMLHVALGARDPDVLFREGVGGFARATGTDERVGRRTWAMLRALGAVDLTVDYVIVDTVRVARPVFAEIIRAWRDGYTDALGERSPLSVAEVRALFDDAIASILDESRYSVWHVPIIAGRKP